jgi:hypothetical protein
MQFEECTLESFQTLICGKDTEFAAVQPGTDQQARTERFPALAPDLVWLDFRGGRSVGDISSHRTDSAAVVACRGLLCQEFRAIP